MRRPSSPPVEWALAGGLAVCAGSWVSGDMHLVKGLRARGNRGPVPGFASHISSDEIGSQYYQ